MPYFSSVSLVSNLKLWVGRSKHKVDDVHSARQYMHRTLAIESSDIYEAPKHLKRMGNLLHFQLRNILTHQHKGKNPSKSLPRILLDRHREDPCVGIRDKNLVSALRTLR